MQSMGEAKSLGNSLCPQDIQGGQEGSQNSVGVDSSS
jgi:hypothetical protein